MSRLLLALLLSAAPARADWEKFAEKQGVLVEWRKVEGSRNREIRATGVLEHQLHKLVHVLRDIEHWPEFMPPTESVKIYDDRGDMRRMHVTINPKLVSRRDYCVEVFWTVRNDGAESRWLQIPDGCPPQQKGVVRHLRTDGTWKLRRIDEHRTYVEYQAITDPAGNIPPWMVDRATAKTMFGMFQSLARRAAEIH